MPLSATMEDIKAYQEKVENNKITSEDLPPCLRCHLKSTQFKIHAYRERRFLIIVDLLVQAVLSALVRFKCTGCGKTFTYYPDFAIPHKHYTRQTVESFSGSYIEDDQMTYQDAVVIDTAVPECQDSGRPLSPSTIHRWISTLAALFLACQKETAPQTPSSGFCHTPAHLTIPEKKYRTDKRKSCLLRCRMFLNSLIFKKKMLARFRWRNPAATVIARAKPEAI